jgi:myosin tail region-interacting protein MTI1
MDSPRPATQDFIANDIDLGRSSHWWTQPRLLPPSLSNRKDVLVDMRESQSGNTVEKIINVLYIDYSQTTVRAEFSMDNVSDVQLEQSHDAPPQRLRPDQLEDAYEQYGRRIAKDVEGKQNTVVGNGTPHSLVEELLKPYQDALPPVSTRAYGALVYANLANASTQSYDEIRPGDIVTFRNAKFQGKTGPMHAKYSAEVGKPDHVGVVVEWDGSKKKVKVWEQGREHKKVKPDSFRMGDLRSGEVRVWRVMSRNWVGWN